MKVKRDAPKTLWHDAIATSFADPEDVAAFKKCKARGNSDLYCFRFGDNGIGKWGDDTTADVAMCALHSSHWKSLEKPRGAEVLVRIKNKETICLLADTGPAGIIDLNPEACKQLGVKIPLKTPAKWAWVESFVKQKP